MSNDLYNLEPEIEVPEFTDEEKAKITSVLEAKQRSSSSTQAGILMPKLSYRFRVLFNNFGNSHGLDITRNIINCETPTYSLVNNVESYSDFKFTVRNDICSLSQLEIRDQIDKQKLTNSTFDCTLEILDGSIGIGTNVLEKREFLGCQIIGVEHSLVDYAMSDTQSITVTVKPTTVKMM